MALALEGTPVHATASTSSLAVGTFTTTKAAQLFLAFLHNGSLVNSISGGGLAWSRRTQSASSGNIIELWTAAAAAAVSGITVTINMGGSVFLTADLFAFSGQDTATIWDGNVAVPANSTGPDPLLISTTNPNDVIIAAFRMSGTSNPTEGSGFTKISGANFQLVEYKIVSAAQTNLSCGIGTGSGGANGCVADALKAEVAAAGGLLMRRRRAA